MRFIIDRFEGDYAICQGEEGDMEEIERTKIPSDSKEGVVLILEGDKFFIDKEETSRLKENIDKLMEEVWGK